MDSHFYFPFKKTKKTTKRNLVMYLSLCVYVHACLYVCACMPACVYFTGKLVGDLKDSIAVAGGGGDEDGEERG